MKQLDLFEKTTKSPVIPDKYKYHDWDKIDHGSLSGLKNDDQMQYYHFPYMISNCKCGQDIRIYYRPKKPELGNYHRNMGTVSPYMERSVEYDFYYCPKCGRKLYIANGKILLIEVIR